VQVTRRGQYPSGEGGGPEGGGGASGEGGGSMAASGRHLRVKVADGVKTIALTAGQELELGLAEPIGGDDPVSRIMDRNPELFLARGYDDGRPPSAFASDPRVLMRDPPFEVHDTGSSQDGESITPDQLAEIERLTQVNDTMIGGKPIRPYGVNISYRPKSLRARNAAERRENTRPSNPITS
jgi:hypothetical protein